ncbi:MAG: alpha/beta hydrolase [Alistipes sp.]|nr:alpha/beta hydrolase [Alistipes sp.]
MKRFLTITLLAGIILSATAQKRVVVSLEDSGADEIVHYWDNSTAPHSNEIAEDEQMNKKFDMTLTSSTDFYIYKADAAKATGQGVVIVPGGGYYKLSMKYDGFMIGQYLRSIGVTAIVVKYRLPNEHREVPLEDAQAALRYMRTEGVKWGVDPQQVGILGSSAGGYLAGHTSNVTPDSEKPAFSILIYSVVDGTKRSAQRGTFGLMLGKNRTDAEQESYSLHNLVSPTTPPTLLLLADDDVRVMPEHSMAYYKALKHYGIPAAMHVFPSGGHGWAGHDEWRYAEPCKRAIKDWLQIMQNLKTK